MPIPADPGVIIHLSSSESDVQEAALRSAANLLSAAGPAAPPVEVVIHGPAVRVCLPGHDLNSLVEDLAGKGVAVTVCERALSGQEIDKAQLSPGVTTVPSAVVELVDKQHQGWAYLRP